MVDTPAAGGVRCIVVTPERAVLDEAVGEVDPLALRHEGHQVGFDFVGVVVSCET